jgi:large subunit ribosomal protein L29
MAQDLRKLRGMTEAELTQEENQLREAVWKLRLQLATGQLQDPQRVRAARKELARVLTIRREGASQQSAGAPVRPRRRSKG